MATQQVSESSTSLNSHGGKAWDDEMLDCLVRLQSLLDQNRTSLKLQDDLFGLLFKGFGSLHQVSNTGSMNKCLASLLVEKHGDWNGLVNGTPIPSKFKEVEKMYSNMGMVAPQNWKLCIGDENAPHNPYLLGPNFDGNGENSSSKCPCKDATSPQSECSICCESCPTCKKPMRDMIHFQYISLIDQLRLLCHSEAFCHDFLKMWRERPRWLNRDIAHSLEFTNNFWDGEKTRIYQRFWDPCAFWEAPIVCKNQYCRMAYRAFPESLRCKELQSNWKEDMQSYIFQCTKCKQWIKEKKTLIKVTFYFQYSFFGTIYQKMYDEMVD